MLLIENLEVLHLKTQILAGKITIIIKGSKFIYNSSRSDNHAGW